MLNILIDKIIWIIDKEGNIYSKDNEVGLRHAEAISLLSKEIGYNISEFNNISDSAKEIIKDGNIVFYNFFKNGNIQKYSGILFIPELLSDKQVEILKNLEDNIKENFEYLTIAKEYNNRVIEINNGTEENCVDIFYNKINGEKKLS